MSCNIKTCIRTLLPHRLHVLVQARVSTPDTLCTITCMVPIQYRYLQAGFVMYCVVPIYRRKINLYKQQYLSMENTHCEYHFVYSTSFNKQNIHLTLYAYNYCKTIICTLCLINYSHRTLCTFISLVNK